MIWKELREIALLMLLVSGLSLASIAVAGGVMGLLQVIHEASAAAL